MTSNYHLCTKSISGYDSNYGKNTVDLFAPSFEIYSTSLNNRYDYYSVTSYADSFVAGIASLILSMEDYCKYECFVNALNAVQLALTYNPIIGYDCFNNQYHEVLTRNHFF